MCVRERESVCVCVCERERERESVCVSMCMCTCAWMSVRKNARVHITRVHARQGLKG